MDNPIIAIFPPNSSIQDTSWASEHSASAQTGDLTLWWNPCHCELSELKSDEKYENISSMKYISTRKSYDKSLWLKPCKGTSLWHPRFEEMWGLLSAGAPPALAAAGSATLLPGRPKNRSRTGERWWSDNPAKIGCDELLRSWKKGVVHEISWWFFLACVSYLHFLV